MLSVKFIFRIISASLMGILLLLFWIDTSFIYNESIDSLNIVISYPRLKLGIFIFFTALATFCWYMEDIIYINE